MAWNNRRSYRSAILSLGTSAAVLLSTAVLAHPALGAKGGSATHGTRNAFGSKFKHPNLRGQSITFIVGASPQASDTTFYEMTRILKSWGAHTHVINVDGDPLALRAVLAGSADVSAGTASTFINGGLEVFGPNQPHVDYFMVGQSSVKNISQLTGHSFGVSNTQGLEALMLRLELAKHHIPLSSVNLQIAGSAGVRVSAMIAGRIDATFAHFDGWLTLKTQGKGVHILATVSKDIPQLADSFLAAKPSWLLAHPKLAIAIDEAYLFAAHFFKTNRKGWIAAADTYTGGQAGTTADVLNTYKTLKKANLFPDDGSGFSSKVLKFNENSAKAVGAITGAAPPLSTWVITSYWNKAVKAVLHHGPK